MQLYLLSQAKPMSSCSSPPWEFHHNLATLEWVLASVFRASHVLKYQKILAWVPVVRKRYVPGPSYFGSHLRTLDPHITNEDKFLVRKFQNAHIAIMGSIDGHKRTSGLFNQLTFDFYNLSSAHSWAVYSVLSALMGWKICPDLSHYRSSVSQDWRSALPWA